MCVCGTICLSSAVVHLYNITPRGESAKTPQARSRDQRVPVEEEPRPRGRPPGREYRTASATCPWFYNEAALRIIHSWWADLVIEIASDANDCCPRVRNIRGWDGGGELRIVNLTCGARREKPSGGSMQGTRLYRANATTHRRSRQHAVGYGSLCEGTETSSAIRAGVKNTRRHRIPDWLIGYGLTHRFESCCVAKAAKKAPGQIYIYIWIYR